LYRLNLFEFYLNIRQVYMSCETSAGSEASIASSAPQYGLWFPCFWRNPTLIAK